MRIYSIEVNNLSCTGEMLCSPVPKGSLGVVVDRCDHDLFECLDGKYFFSNCDGIVKIYGWSKGSRGGFGDAKITLKVKEPSVIFPKIQSARIRKFHGDLWSSAEANRAVEKHLNTKLHQIGFRESGSRYSVYCSATATSEFMERIAKVVILGAAQSSPDL